MSNQESTEVLAIMNYVKDTQLKGSVDIEENGFSWSLGDINLRFYIDNRETTVEYFRSKGKFFPIGHFHEDNFDVIKLIQDINSENNNIKITASPFGSSFEIIEKTAPKKKSRFLIRRYYSI